MSDQVLIFVADDNYIDHVKSLVANCWRQGQWQGDIAVISPRGSQAASEFRNYGFHVLEVDTDGFLQKFSVFDPFFKQWDKALYLDCDILVQNPLSRLMALLAKGDLWMDTEDGTTMESLWRFRDKPGFAEACEGIRKAFAHADQQTFNSAFIVFNPAAIPEATVAELMDVQEFVQDVNNPGEGGTDQQTINFLLAPRIKKIPEKLVCWWGMDEPENQVVSEARGWVGGEIPVALHYSRWYAPWIEKPLDQGAYWLRRLNRPCLDVYRENLQLFPSLVHKS